MKLFRTLWIDPTTEQTRLAQILTGRIELALHPCSFVAVEDVCPRSGNGPLGAAHRAAATTVHGGAAGGCSKRGEQAQQLQSWASTVASLVGGEEAARRPEPSLNQRIFPRIFTLVPIILSFTPILFVVCLFRSCRRTCLSLFLPPCGGGVGSMLTLSVHLS